VGICTGYAGQPTYLLYDEPTSGLDPVNGDIIDKLVESCRVSCSPVFGDAYVRGAFRVRDRVAPVKDGKIRRWDASGAEGQQRRAS